MSKSIITSNPLQKGALNSRVKFLAFLHTPQNHGIARKARSAQALLAFQEFVSLKSPESQEKIFYMYAFWAFPYSQKSPELLTFFYHRIYISALCIVCLTVVTFFLYLKTDTALCVVLYTTSVIDMSSAIVLCYIICRSIPSCYQLNKPFSSRFELVGKKKFIY